MAAEIELAGDGSGEQRNADAGMRDQDVEQPRTLSGTLRSEALLEIRKRWRRTALSLVVIILFAAEHQQLLKWLGNLVGDPLEPYIGGYWAEVLVFWIVVLPLLLLLVVWAGYRSYQIRRKWDETRGDLNATTRLDCAMAYVRALRLYVNLKTLYERMLAAALVFGYVAIRHLLWLTASGVGMGLAVWTSLPLAIVSAILLWRSFRVGHKLFHPGAAMAKSVLWLHIQAHEKDTSATERNLILIEDQMRIREEHPVWYIDYEILGNRRA